MRLVARFSAWMLWRSRHISACAWSTSNCVGRVSLNIPRKRFSVSEVPVAFRCLYTRPVSTHACSIVFEISEMGTHTLEFNRSAPNSEIRSEDLEIQPMGFRESAYVQVGASERLR